MMYLRHLIPACLCLLAAFPVSLSGQQEPVEQAMEVAPEKRDGIDPDILRYATAVSPRATLVSFLQAMENYYDELRHSGRTRENTTLLKWMEDRILACVGITQHGKAIRRDMGMTGAVRIYEIIARVGHPSLEEIPDLAELRAMSPDERPRFWRLGDTPIEITLLEEGEQAGRWVFNIQQLGNVQLLDYYQLIEDLPYEPGFRTDLGRLYNFTPGWLVPSFSIRSLPSWMGLHFMEQTIWQWMLMFISVFVCGAAMFILVRWSRRVSRGFSEISRGIFRLVPLSIVVICINFLDHFLDQHVFLTGEILFVMTVLLSLVRVGVLMAIVIQIGSIIATLIIKSPRIPTRGIDASLIRIGCKSIAIIVALVILFINVSEIGFSPAALLTSAGISGLAIALAAQDTLKNFFASLVLLTERPFKLGDVIAMEEGLGIIKDIGIRSTRISLLDGTLVTVPNEQLVVSQIENISERPSIRHDGIVKIVLDTPPEKIEQGLQAAREILADTEGIVDKPQYRVHFDRFGDNALIIRYKFYYAPPDWDESLVAKEQVNIAIARRFHELGISFAVQIPLSDESVGGGPNSI